MSDEDSACYASLRGGSALMVLGIYIYIATAMDIRPFLLCVPQLFPCIYHNFKSTIQVKLGTIIIFLQVYYGY